MPDATTRIKKWWASPLVLGVIGSVLITLGSFGGGAIRYRGGVLDALGLNFLTYGHGQGYANTVLFIGTALLIIAWVLMGRRLIVSWRGRKAAGTESSDQVDGNLAETRRSLWAWIIPLVAAAPIMSRDVYSYLMQGAMMRDGFDPYTEGAAINPGPMLLEVSHDWRNTTTPYGPLHLWIGDMVTSVVGDNVTVGVVLYKIISIIGFAGIAFAIPRIAAHLGADPAIALWIGVANPLMVLHMVGGMHNESVMVGLVSVGLLLALRQRFIVAVAIIAVAVALKATAAIALPFVVWIAMHGHARKLADARDQDSPSPGQYAMSFFGTGTVAVVVTGIVVSAVTWVSGSSWGWLSEITGNSKVINPLAAPTLATSLISIAADAFTEEFPFNAVLDVMRRISMVIMLLGLVIVWWLSRRSPRAAIAGTAAAYAVAFVFNSVTLPWYYASLISLVGVFRAPILVLKLATGASVFIALSFTGSGNHQLFNIPYVIGTALVSWLVVILIFAERDNPRLAYLDATLGLSHGRR